MIIPYQSCNNYNYVKFSYAFEYWFCWDDFEKHDEASKDYKEAEEIPSNQNHVEPSRISI